MTDEHAPVTKGLRVAREHLRSVHERREAAQQRSTAWRATHTQPAEQSPTPPATEAPQ